MIFWLGVSLFWCCMGFWLLEFGGLLLLLGVLFLKVWLKVWWFLSFLIRFLIVMKLFEVLLCGLFELLIMWIM